MGREAFEGGQDEFQSDEPICMALCVCVVCVCVETKMESLDCNNIFPITT